jgi:hypothetical protein
MGFFHDFQGKLVSDILSCCCSSTAAIATAKKNPHRCSLGLIFAKPEKRMVFVVEYVIIDIAFMKTLK